MLKKIPKQVDSVRNYLNEKKEKITAEKSPSEKELGD
jgi:hypothetical protein